MHKMFIMFIGIGIRKTRNTDDSLGSGMKLLLPSLRLGFRHEERETQFFYADCSSIVSSQLTDPTNTFAPQSTNCTGLAQVRKINLLRLSPNLNSLLLFKIRIPAHPFRAWHHSHPQFNFYLGVLPWHLWLLHPPPARVWTPASMSAPTHALSRKVLSLTKPKDKIYKTKNDNIKKSFRNWTTRLEWH